MDRQRRIARLAAALWASVGLSLIAPAHAGPSPHKVTGSWPGFFQSVDEMIRVAHTLHLTSGDALEGNVSLEQEPDGGDVPPPVGD